MGPCPRLTSAPPTPDRRSSSGLRQRVSLGAGGPRGLAELLGTALMLFGGFSMTALVGAPSSPLFVRAMTERVFVIGLSYGVMVALVAVSPIGRSSGAHLNPAVTVAFWCRRAVSTSDAVAYVVAQCVGALAAAIAFSAIWRSWATAVHGARTIPRPGLGAAATAMIEAGMTFVLVAAIFVVSTSPRWRRWTPVAVLVLLTVMIVVAGPVTGGSFNPARSLGPALVTHQWEAFIAYVVGPLAGALVAVLATHRSHHERDHGERRDERPFCTPAHRP